MMIIDKKLIRTKKKIKKRYIYFALFMLPFIAAQVNYQREEAAANKAHKPVTLEKFVAHSFAKYRHDKYKIYVNEMTIGNKGRSLEVQLVVAGSSWNGKPTKEILHQSYLDFAKVLNTSNYLDKFDYVGVKYLTSGLNKYGNETKAAAAYLGLNSKELKKINFKNFTAKLIPSLLSGNGVYNLDMKYF